ncbi:PAS domain S-box protein [Fontisphaera persica]|uniref:hybrid sensor histidine kinase/response regulator n=1 Tax=Fontisphaera persica TaxID=2974023 RepID=UPI0024C0DF65|nr:PAS domain-containing sensor histidine kinase [Fontisphaera persica]WCJ59854.1 PAS domain S-box protein [Fontisphaera persica]
MGTGKPSSWAPWHQATRALLQTEAACCALFEHSKAGIIHWSLEGQCVAANPAFALLAGQAENALPGQAMSRLVAPEDWRQWPEICSAWQAGPSRHQAVTWRLLRADGAPIACEFFLSPVTDAQGVLVGGAALVFPLAPQDDLHLLTRLQTAALHVLPHPVVITNAAGAIIFVNRAFTEETGYTLEEVLGKNPRLLNSGRHDRYFFQRYWDTILAGKTWTGEIVNRRKDGSFYTQEQRVTPIRDARGRITHFIAIQQDITARKRLETELRHARERFQRIFRANPMAIGICAQNDGRFIEVNDSYVKLMGYTREELIGRSASELRLWVNPAQREQLMMTLQRHGSVTNMELQLRTKTGAVVDVLTSVEPLQVGLEACWLFIDVDITARKTLEAQLRQSAKMEGIGALAGGVAHDFNNLLTVMKGHTEMLASLPGLPPQAQASVHEIAEATDRASNLTRQLLAFSRKQAFQPSPVQLNDVLAQVTKMLRRIIGEDVTLEIHPAPSLPMIMADVGMLEQVIFNLAVNARDAMPHGGRLTIATDSVAAASPPEAPPGQQPPAPYVRLVVKDTGCGIPPDLHQRVFEPFFTTKELGMGTGLGLATVRSIVEQHQGWIELRSQVGEGTCFLIYLPTLQSPAAAKPPKAATPPGLPTAPYGKETILVVEDEAVVRQLAGDILNLHGYRVILAANGPEALALWAKHHQQIDGALLDMVMPGGINGLALAQKLREQRPNLPILFTSGYFNSQMLLESTPGFHRHHFLQKPYTPMQLAQVLRTVLDAYAATRPTTPPPSATS